MKNLKDRFAAILVAAAVVGIIPAVSAQSISSANGAAGQQSYQGQSRPMMPVAVGSPTSAAMQPRSGLATAQNLWISPPQITYFGQSRLPYPYPWNSPYPSPFPNPYTPQNSYYAPPVGYPSGFLSGFNYTGYTTSDYDDDMYPAIYGDYVGMPDYFDGDDSVIVSPPSNTVYDDGTWYPYGYDPFSQAASSEPDDGSDADNANSGESSDPAIPEGMSRTLNDIAQSWKTHDASAVERHLSSNSQVQVRFNGTYYYSIGARDCALMTRDAVERLGTTDFKFTGVSVQRNGDSIGYAEHTYRAPNGGVGTMYLAYTLRKDPSQTSGYDLIGVDSSTRPLVK